MLQCCTNMHVLPVSFIFDDVAQVYPLITHCRQAAAPAFLKFVLQFGAQSIRECSNVPYIIWPLGGSTNIALYYTFSDK